MPRLRVGPDYRMDEDSNFSNGLRSRSRSPHPIVGFTSKEEQERQDHELALRLQEEEVNRAHSPVVEATLRPEEIEAILGSDYSIPAEQNVLTMNLEDSDMETISIRSSLPPDSPPPPPPSPPPLSEGEAEMYDGEFTLPDWSEHTAAGDVALGPLWNEHDANADSDSGDDINASEDDDSDDDGGSDEDVHENENVEAHDDDDDDDDDDDTDESANDSDDEGGHIEEQSDDSGEEMDDSELQDDNVAPAETHGNDDDSDSSSSDSSDSDDDNNDHRSETPEQFLIRAYADLNSIELALTDLETIIENNRRELLAEESHQDFEEEEEPEPDDTVIRSGDYGRCTICFEEMPYDPVGCIYCQQLVGCRRCINRWYAAANRGGDSIDILGGHPPSNHKQCPLCRHEWPDQVEVTSIFLLRDD